MNYKILLYLSALYELPYGMSPFFSIPPSLESFCHYDTIPQDCCLSEDSSRGKNWEQHGEEKGGGKNLRFVALPVCLCP